MKTQFPRRTLTRPEWTEAYRVARVTNKIPVGHRPVNELALRYAFTLVPERTYEEMLATFEDEEYCWRAYQAIQ